MALDAIINSLSSPLLVLGADRAVREGNTAAGLFWRRAPQRLVGLDIYQLLPEGQGILEATQRAIVTETSSILEGVHFHITDTPGHTRTLLLRVQVDPLLEPGQPVDAAIVQLLDTTLRDQVESQVRDERLQSSIALMMTRLAHELRNPVSGIKGAAQLLARELQGHSRFGEYPEVMLKELERMERLLHNMLGSGHDLHLNTTPFNLHELLDEVLWFEHNSATGIEFERLYDPSLPELVGDRDRLYQVFLNLIRNAVQASPQGGTVHLYTAIRANWQGHAWLPETSGPFFEIEITDEGAGVPPEAEGVLFTPFFTTKKQGTGLGLSISYQIVRAHGGFLRHRGTPGKGATFTVHLPMQTGA